MTCIVGFIDKENEVLHMIGDSLGSGGGTGTIEKNPKVFCSKDFSEILMGSTSTFRQIDVLKYNHFFDETEVLRGIDIDHEYMVMEFIPRLQHTFESCGIMRKSEGEVSGGNFLFGTTKNLFEIQGDFSVLESDSPYNAVGCGEDHAKASLFSTEKSDKSIKERLILALECAEHFCTGVKRPFVYINTLGETEVIK